MPDLQISAIQTVFMVFYAIFWGGIFGVLPRWKAFQFPLVCKFLPATCRVALSILVLNILPILFFGYVMVVLGFREQAHDVTWSREIHDLFVGAPRLSPWLASLNYVISGVLPAFAIFGFYRIWLGIVESRPNHFYTGGRIQIPKEYRHVEPVFRQRINVFRANDEPVVDIAEGAGKANIAFGFLYIVIAAVAPWICFPW
jgi:hypothetical protein